CDGQVLVYQDMLGMYSDFTPKFVKKYADLGSIMKDAFKAYIDDLDNGSFPQNEHSYTIDDEIIEKLY
ncbi:MAG: 3-methyl-2-oxobutanoate hydroxymethyltransferase, partial [Acutalibacteraceae bacterium]|nr:3-methyl-2-oxobutanoate hydroxymethyltransferase [Acutalibacteraceae bacterium]